MPDARFPGDDGAVLHVQHCVGELEDARVVSDDEDCAPLVEDVLAHEGDDVSAGVTVEGGGGLVENQNLRLADDCAGDGHPLLLAAAQLHRWQVGAVLQAHDRQGLYRRVERPPPGHTPEDQRNGDVLGRREAREEMVVLEDEADPAQAKLRQFVGRQRPDVAVVDPNCATVRPQDARDHAEQGRLAAAGGPDEIEHLAIVGGEARVVDR